MKRLKTIWKLIFYYYYWFRVFSLTLEICLHAHLSSNNEVKNVESSLSLLILLLQFFSASNLFMSSVCVWLIDITNTLIIHICLKKQNICLFVYKKESSIFAWLSWILLNLLEDTNVFAQNLLSTKSRRISHYGFF